MNTEINQTPENNDDPLGLNETWNLFFGDIVDDGTLDDVKPRRKQNEPAVTVKLVGDIADPDTNPHYVVTVNGEAGYAEIAEALEIVEATQPSSYATEEEATKEYFDLIWEATEDKQAVKRAKGLKAKGAEYYALGYRLHKAQREVVAHVEAPSNAIWSSREWSGYLATNPTSRLVWLTKE